MITTSCSILSQSPVGSEPILIGFVAPFTGVMASSSVSTWQGMLLAINEINEAGGVLGHPLVLENRSVETDPQAGEQAVAELIDLGAVAIFGGVYDDVIMGYLDELAAAQIPLLNVWATLPSIVKNGYDPNVTFCIAAAAGQITEYLARYPLEVLNSQRPALIVEASNWGNAHAELLSWRFAELGIPTVRIERFRVGVTNMHSHIRELRKHNVDSIILIANSREAAVATRTIHSIGWQVPIISHPNIQANVFVDQAGPAASEGVYVMHTKAFMVENSARQQHLIDSYQRFFHMSGNQRLPNPGAVARGYDGVYLLATAMAKSGVTDKNSLLYALLNDIDMYKGVLKEYRSPFSQEVRNPFDVGDYVMARFQKGRLVPAERAVLN
ncbi:MAG: ABC transporter substrate-binding protein [Chloroflexota bacterium]